MASERRIKIVADFDASSMIAGINKFRQEMSNIRIDPNLFKDINKDLDKISKGALDVNAAIKNGVPEKSMGSLLNKIEEITKLYTNLPQKIKQVEINTNNIKISNNTIQRLEQIRTEVQRLGDETKKVLGSNLKESINKLVPEKILGAKAIDELVEASNKTEEFQKKLDLVTSSADKAKSKLENAFKTMADTAIPAPKFNNKGAITNQDAINKANSRIAFGQLGLEALNNNTLIGQERTMNQLYMSAGATDKQSQTLLDNMENYKRATQEVNVLETNRAQILNLIANAEKTASDNTQKMNSLTQESSKLINKEVQEQNALKNGVVGTATAISTQGANSFKKLGDSVQNTNTHIQKQDSLLKQLVYRASSIIGIGAIFNYITRGVREAWQGIKDLDKEFTQIAVVTDKTTSQLWNSFGTYSQMAQALGVTTKDAVATSALYYQQGLKTADVMTLTAETIKMAQIAGMDFATATNQMTAAIRGFNLEMDDASKVNDIFSTLAANAAVSTEELAYALTKTASIAESAGMSIDTTSAFLTKMIETTREAPENIGTAMKSIVARFEELKKNPLALKVEVEGEDVVANKVEAAIALAGVRLRDETTGQFRDLDEVFLELAKSWDNLDRNTQRYIATIAAGSRQQSRFIAMMDGYDRTLELVELAQDSEGQSAAQFLKTLDSLDSKLNQVSNSLEQIYQKFVNSDFFGGLLDSLNNFLQQAGKLDAGTLALYATMGVIIGNNIIKGITSVVRDKGAGFMTAVNQKLGNTVSAKDALLTSKINQRYEEKLSDKEKDKKIKIDIDGREAEVTLEELNNKINELTEKKHEIQVEVNRSYGYQDDADVPEEKYLNDLNHGDEYRQNEANLQKAQENLEQANKQLETNQAERIQAMRQNLGNMMISVGGSLVSSLAIGITTALNSDNPMDSVLAGLSTFALSALPQAFNLIATAVSNGVSVIEAAGGPFGLIIAGIGMVLSVSIPALVSLVNSFKTETQRLEEEIANLEEKQKELEETSEKLNAESALEKTKYKKLQNLTSTYDDLIDKVGKTSEENDKLNKTIEELGNDFPDLIDYYDEAGNAVLKQRKEWETIIELQKESAKEALNASLQAKLGLDVNKLQIAQDSTALNSARSIDRLGLNYNKASTRYANGINGLSTFDFIRELDFGKGIDQIIKDTNFKNKESVDNLRRKYAELLTYNSDLYQNTTFGFTAGENLDNALGMSNEKIFSKLAQGSAEKAQKLYDNVLGYASTHLIQTEEDFQELINNSGNEDLSSELGELDADTKQTIIENLGSFYQDIDNVVNQSNRDYESEEYIKAINQVQKDLQNYFMQYIQTFRPDVTEDFGEKGLQRLGTAFAKQYQEKAQGQEMADMFGKLGGVNKNMAQEIDAYMLENAGRRLTGEEMANLQAAQTVWSAEGIEGLRTGNKEQAAAYDQMQTLYQEIIAKLAEDWANQFGDALVKMAQDVENGGVSQKTIDILNSQSLGAYSEVDLDTMLKEAKGYITDEDARKTLEKMVQDIKDNLEKLGPGFEELGKQYGYDIAQGLKDSGASAEMATDMEETLSGLKDQDKVPRLVELLTGDMDWGNIDQLKRLGVAFVEAGDSAEEAVEHVMHFSNELKGAIKLDITESDFSAYFSELGKSVQDAAKDFKDLYSAMEEYNDNGKLSAQTIIDLIAAGKTEYLTIDETTKALKINSQAVEENWQAKMNEATATLDLQIEEQKSAQASLKIQLAVEQRKLEILKSSKAKGGQITATELNELRKLEQAHAVDIINGQIKTNAAILTQDNELFTQLFNDRAEEYKLLVEQAAFYGKEMQDAMITGVSNLSKESLPTFNILSDYWKEAQEKQASGYAKSITGGATGAVYTFNTAELDKLIDEQDKLVQALQSEIDNRQEVLDQLEATKAKIHEITTGSNFVDYMKDTGKATKDANKELKEYISSLERFYNLNKEIEQSERKLSRAEKEYKRNPTEENAKAVIAGYEETAQGYAKRYSSGKLQEQEDRRDAKKDLEELVTKGKIKLSKEEIDSLLERTNLKEGQTGVLNQRAFKEWQAEATKAGKLTYDNAQTIEKDWFDSFKGKVDADVDMQEDSLDKLQESLDNAEDFKDELEKIRKALDPLTAIKAGIAAANKLMEKANEELEEYYKTGGRDGMSTLEYAHTVGSKMSYNDYYIEQIKDRREQVLQEAQSNGLSQYIVDLNNGQYTYDVSASKIVDDKQRQKIEDLIKALNDLGDTEEELVKDNNNLSKSFKNLLKENRQQYSDLVNDVAEALAKLDQKEIDEVKKKYAMIQEEDDKYLDSLQKSIDKQRQLRDQARSYDDLEKDEKRLALLERDTSGANASEIAALREQIKDKRTNLVDTEQDNIVNNIAEENQNRKDKMDEETKFLQNVMDERTYDMQYYIDKAYDIVNAAINGDEGAYQRMLKVLQETDEAFYKTTKEGQEIWLESLQERYTRAQGHFDTIKAGLNEVINATNQEVHDTITKFAEEDNGHMSAISKGIEDLQGKTGFIDLETFTNAQTEADKTITKIQELIQNLDNIPGEKEITIKWREDKSELEGGGGTLGSGKPSSAPGLSDSGKYAVSRYDSATNRNVIIGYTDNEDKAKDSSHLGGQGRYDLTSTLNVQKEEGKGGYEYFQAPAQDSDINNEKYYLVDEDNNIVLEKDYSAEIKKEDIKKYCPTGTCSILSGRTLKNRMQRVTFYKAFATGGLVDFTGPAWVDGTPSQPEAFLSASDTRNIQTLTEVLNNVISSAVAPVSVNKQETKNGDTNIEMHVNVEGVNETDEDWEETAQRVGEIFADSVKNQVNIVNTTI